jgi:ribosomal protein S21
MSVRVDVREGERIEQALKRLNMRVSWARLFYCVNERQWRLTSPSGFRRYQEGKALIRRVTGQSMRQRQRPPSPFDC